MIKEMRNITGNEEDAPDSKEESPPIWLPRQRPLCYRRVGRPGARQPD